MGSSEDQIYLAVCLGTTCLETTVPGSGAPGADEDGPHNLGPPFRNPVIARLWLSNYLAATADSMELDGDHDDLAAAYRDAVAPMRKHGHATVGSLRYEICPKSG
ncbi:hypothetical protein SMC26_39975 [Actinomadura fulvescens]|uniref:Uncharacterized protein n=1 Tax=Actinomadura fulvescens TaxID=46160 RepID=A0ABN3QYD5_9ACTN